MGVVRHGVTGVPQACHEALARCGNSVSHAGTRVAMSVMEGKSCSRDELRDRLQQLNQSTRGRKEELMQRLESECASVAAVGAQQKRQRLSGEGKEDEEVGEAAAKKTTKEKDDDDDDDEEEEENTNHPKTDTAMEEASQILVGRRVSKRGRSDHVTEDEVAQDEELANAKRGLQGEESSDDEEEEDASVDGQEKNASDDHGGRKNFVMCVFPVSSSKFAPLLMMPKKFQLPAWREIEVDENMTYMLLVEKIAKCIAQTTMQKFQAATTTKFSEGHTIMQRS